MAIRLDELNEAAQEVKRCGDYAEFELLRRLYLNVQAVLYARDGWFSIIHNSDRDVRQTMTR